MKGTDDDTSNVSSKFLEQEALDSYAEETGLGDDGFAGWTYAGSGAQKSNLLGKKGKTKE